MRHGGQPKGAPGSVGKSVQQKKGWFTMGLLRPGKILPRQILPGKMSTSCDSGMICNEESHWFPRIVCYFALENAEIPNEKILRGGWVIGKSEGLSGKIIKMMTGWSSFWSYPALRIMHLLKNDEQLGCPLFLLMFRAHWMKHIRFSWRLQSCGCYGPFLVTLPKMWLSCGMITCWDEKTVAEF